MNAFTTLSRLIARACFWPCQVSSSLRTESTAASLASSLRDSMSWYISRTFTSHWTIASRSSLAILPSVRELTNDLCLRTDGKIVRQLAQLVGGRARVGLLEDVLQEALAEVAGLLELLRVDAGYE